MLAGFTAFEFEFRKKLRQIFKKNRCISYKIYINKIIKQKM